MEGQDPALSEATSSSDASMMPPPVASAGGGLGLRRMAHGGSGKPPGILGLKRSKEVEKTKLEREVSGYLRANGKLMNRVPSFEGSLNAYRRVSEGHLGAGNSAEGVRKYEKDLAFYAIKTFENARHGSKTAAATSLSLFPVATSSEREEILREAQIMFELDHPNVIKIVEVIDDSKSDSNLESKEDEMHIVMDFIDGGSMQDRIEKDHPLQETQLHSWFLYAARGLAYLHSKGVLHLDMKPANLLLSDGVVKICDFGTSTWGDQLKRAKDGTPLFSAPETRVAKIKSAEAGKAADVWSLAASFYYAFYWGRGYTNIMQVDSALRENPVALLSNPSGDGVGGGDSTQELFLKEFLCVLLDHDASTRMTMDKVLDATYLTPRDGEALVVESEKNFLGPLIPGATWVGEL